MPNIYSIVKKTPLAEECGLFNKNVENIKNIFSLTTRLENYGILQRNYC